jgi:regulator of replication initiation timing
MDIRNIVILCLLVALIFLFIKKESIQIDYRNGELDNLKNNNKILLTKNDSLLLLNKKLDEKLLKLSSDIENEKIKIKNYEKEIERLKNKKDEIPTYINSLPANGIADIISDCISRAK